MDGASLAVREAAVPEGSAATLCLRGTCERAVLPGRGPRTTEMCGCSEAADGGSAAVRRNDFSNRPGDCGRSAETGGSSGVSVGGASAMLSCGAVEESACSDGAWLGAGGEAGAGSATGDGRATLSFC